MNFKKPYSRYHKRRNEKKIKHWRSNKLIETKIALNKELKKLKKLFTK